MDSKSVSRLVMLPRFQFKEKFHLNNFLLLKLNLLVGKILPYVEW